jgi:hypothetical protein
MNGFDLLGQLYLMCSVFGWGFIVFSLLMGQFGHDSHDLGHDGGHAGGQGIIDAAHGIHHLDGGDVGHINHIGHGHSGLTGGHHTATTGSHSADHDGQAQNQGDDSRSHINQVIPHTQRNLYFTLLSIFSPMSISVFIGFFGIAGLFVRGLFPILGAFTLIPALLTGIVATNLMKVLLAWITSKISASSLTSSTQAIGQIAEVNTPIKDGRLGEVTYVIGLTRFNAAAKPAKEGVEMARGAKVIIVESEGPVVLVEPFLDA